MKSHGRVNITAAIACGLSLFCATHGHAAWFGPTLTLSSDGAAVGWIEPEPAGSNGVSGVVVTMLDGLVAPIVDPDFDAFEGSGIVTVTVDSAYATIHYTLDGSDPVEADVRVPPGGSVVINTDKVVLRARAFREWSSASQHYGVGIYYANAIRPYLGDFLEPLAGTRWAAGDPPPTIESFPAGTMPAAVHIQSERRLLCVNPESVVLVGWWDPTTSTYVTNAYAVRPTAAPGTDVARLFPNTGAYVGPPIEFPSALKPVLHTNQFVTADLCGLNETEDELILKQSIVEKKLVVLHYEDAASDDFVGVEIVEIQPYEPDAVTTNVLLGDWLQPSPPPPANKSDPPHVGKGSRTFRDEQEYIYKHDNPEGGAAHGKCLAVQVNSDPTRMEIFWMEERTAGESAELVRWPYEMHRYTVSSNPVQDMVRMYFTEESDGHYGPKVDLSEIWPVRAVVHPNQHLTGDDFWLEEVGTARRLHAKDKPGLTVLHYQDQDDNFLGVEIVDVRPYAPVDVPEVRMGDWLEPAEDRPNRVSPHVGRGAGMVQPLDQGEYIYRHNKSGDLRDNELLAIQPVSPDELDMEVFWMEERQFGLHWPYEMRRYTVNGLSREPVSIYHTEGSDSRAPPVTVGGKGVSTVIHPNLAVTEGSLWEDSSLLHAKDDTGYCLVHFENSGFFDSFEIVDVRPYLTDYTNNVEVSSRIEPAAYTNDMPRRHHVARGLMANQDDGNGYIWEHTDQSTSNPGPYHGAMFAARPTGSSLNMEVFWLRKSLHDIEWPYEMHRYTASVPPDGSYPPKAQRFVRRRDDESDMPKVAIPPELNPHKMPWEDYETGDEAFLAGNAFHSVMRNGDEGYSLLSYEKGPEAAREWVGLQVVHSVPRDDAGLFDLTPTNWYIGSEITNHYHDGPRAPYIFKPIGDRYAPGVYGEASRDPLGWTMGLVYAVNTGELETWWCNTGPATNLAARIQWPSLVQRFNNLWPTNAEQIVIADEQGTGPIDEDVYRSPALYVQNYTNQVGYNPNDEHALMWPAGTNVDGQAIFPLRSDLGSPETSLPFVLMTYTDTNDWRRLYVYSVTAETATVQFRYEATAGLPIQAPYPLSTLQASGQSYAVTTNRIWKDRKGGIWAYAAGDDGGTAEDTCRFFYTIQKFPHEPDGFFFPPHYPAPPEGEHVPWLDVYAKNKGEPVDVSYVISWPTDVPSLHTGETRTKGAPDIWNQKSVDILYQQAEALSAGSEKSVMLIDPIVAHEVPLAALPGDMQTDSVSGVTVFPGLPMHLRARLTYDELARNLSFKGLLVEPPAGEDYLLLNVMTFREKSRLLLASDDGAFETAIVTLGAQAFEVTQVPPNTPFEKLALTAGVADAPGYVTLAFGNSRDLNLAADPVSLEVIRVVTNLYEGELKVIESDNVFDESLVLRHSGDFAGLADEYTFEWRRAPAGTGGVAPDPPTAGTPGIWVAHETDPASGNGSLDVTIEGSGILMLSDNYFTCRYTPRHPAHPAYGQTSKWTNVQLAEGWIKRVLGDLDPFRQRHKNGGLDGADARFSAFRDNEVSTIVSMIEQAGPRAEGSIALNSDAVDEYGLIEIYETVLDRGSDMSINAGITYPPANDALLLAAGRIADLYMLLGNEAYADATDPTIGFGTDYDVYSEAAPSVHCFMNQTASLLEEELKLLRGRDDTLLPPVDTPPFYNRLVWNISGDIVGGEPAYVLNYQVEDVNDGSIAEAAARMYPQGHGDAWGHYLTAAKGYYGLLRNANFGWEPRIEAVLIGGVPVSVDYMDERKFARVGAAKARTGAEIVALTHRDRYDEDPRDQWRAHKDTNTNRAWGVTEWAQRVGQGAFFDWVVGNSLLPSEDTNTAHRGIQKVDRLNVRELAEIASAYQEVQSKLDVADSGLNPLGLAKNVVPFDIDPSQLDQGRGHFEQIYDRAVGAMNNAIVVFNHAQDASAQLRKQADTVADFQGTVDEREADFNNRLIEIFGYPYEDDIGPTGNYPTGYDGPDLDHYMYVDASALITESLATRHASVPTASATLNLSASFGPSISVETKVATYSLWADGPGIIKDPSWTGQRRAEGELQRILSEIILAVGRFRQISKEYSNLKDSIARQTTRLEEEYDLNAREIVVLNLATSTQQYWDEKLLELREKELKCRRAALLLSNITGTIGAGVAAVGGFLTAASAGTATPVTGGLTIGGAIVAAGSGLAGFPFIIRADRRSQEQLAVQQTMQMNQAADNIALTTLRQQRDVLDRVQQLEQLAQQEAVIWFEVEMQAEMLGQMIEQYQTTLARGQRLLEEQLRFGQQTAAQTQQYRYRDMAFRIFRNDALQKYRAQFDLAARYVYLAARAYDYETNFKPGTGYGPGAAFMNQIVRARSLGQISGGLPVTGGYDSGLADPMARMAQVWSVLEGQMGFNNPQTETGRFSLRYELFRALPGRAGNEAWREELRGYVVDDILALPEFQRHCLPFYPQQDTEPGLVIPFATTINFGKNFFGHDAGGGDNSYDSANFATKIRSVGIWFANYNSLISQGLVNTPRVYLIPVGRDIMRSPNSGGEIRDWNVVDQVLPVPFALSGAELSDPDWIPMNDSLFGSFAQIRRIGRILAHHDSGTFNPAEMINDSRLIGRSVWNSEWMLIIPAGALHSDRQLGLDRFIDGITDIKIFFQTYAFQGYRRGPSVESGGEE